MTKDTDGVPASRDKSNEGPIEVEAVPIEPAGPWGGSSRGYSAGQGYNSTGSDGRDGQAHGPWTQQNPWFGQGQRPRIVRVPSWVVFVPAVLVVVFVVMLFKVFGLFLLLAMGILLLVLRLNALRIAVAQWLIRQALKRRGM
jgi:hypothetical protein